MKVIRAIAWAILGCCMFACNENVVYSAYEDIPDGMWYLDNKPTFKVSIDDTTQRYHVYYLIRNSLQYPYYNLYISKKITGPDGQPISSMLDELFMSNQTTGKPFGKGLGDLFDHKIPVLQNYTFDRKGEYTFTLTQSMRQNPLPFVMSVGISVEKAVQTP
ncbi:gliding motility-associated lipoprotein GldH [Dyadobacter jejuensis]|uniref:Gliding motility-associated lipoprotein GldH n=1 Tax=Dyadobacter jejuensis TaxID=1082580 RepID=A0A316AHW1_9BACT|nr:gliding motility lipoprotein GldH [Dyadobacter jejuensis]PWJ56520.1 gliding motility-associated lipoprotein GldH [Dyadobacter jejuensis]